MASFADRIGAATRAFLAGIEARAPKVKPANPAFSYTGATGGVTSGIIGARKGAVTLRRYSERNVWVRTAINRRKGELSRAQWAITRLDDPRKKPDESVVQAVGDLFRFVNPTGLSLHQLIAQVVEDILVFDAGCIYMLTTANGKQIKELWPVSGDEIMPIYSWDGSSPREPRYVQIRNGHKIATYRNDELIYMMSNPRTCSPIGFSPMENLIATIEADLYGEYYEYAMQKETAPAGILYLGGGVPPDKVQAFREQWEADIAGTRDVAILGGGGYDPESGSVATPPSFIEFKKSAREEQRREYMKWNATKVASAFEMDLMAFNLSETVHRSIGENLQAKTDAGLMNLAFAVGAFFTREIVWRFDPTFSHGFEFINLTPQDEMAKAKRRALYMTMGYTFPNELRQEDGLDAVPWGDQPFPMQMKGNAEDPAQMGDDDAPSKKKTSDEDDD